MLNVKLKMFIKNLIIQDNIVYYIISLFYWLLYIQWDQYYMLISMLNLETSSQ